MTVRYPLEIYPIYLHKILGNDSYDNKVQYYIKKKYVSCIYAILQQIDVYFVKIYKLMFCLLSSHTLQELLFVCPSFFYRCYMDVVILVIVYLDVLQHRSKMQLFQF